MEQYKVIYRKRLCEKCSHIFSTTNPAVSMEHLYYGTIFFFTAAKEIAIIQGKDSKLQEIAEIIENYAKTKHKQTFIVRTIHTAWEHFADKSEKGYSFHIWGMFPKCPNCGNHDTSTIKMVDVLIEEIEAQPILYTQWDLHSHKEKEKILHAFFDQYMEEIERKYGK